MALSLERSPSPATGMALVWAFTPRRNPRIMAGMAVSELDMSPRLRGRAKAELLVEYIGPVGASDIALLASERSIQPKPIAKIRDRHHALARALALGMSDSEASAVTGYTPSRISILKSDDTFKQLMNHYREVGDAATADFTDRATTLAISAINTLQERLDEEEGDEPLPTSMVLEIAKTFADRTGHAPVQKNVNLNANVDLGNRLATARRRLAERAVPAPGPIDIRPSESIDAIARVVSDD